MADYPELKRKKVRASVIRRTVVGSLVVMLSPFLTVLEHNADASFQDRQSPADDAAPAIARSLPEATYPSISPKSGLFPLGKVESLIRREAHSYWAYQNAAPEAARPLSAP